MGKKVKKGKQPRKPSHRQAASSPRAGDSRKSSDSKPEQVGAEAMVDGDPCEHYEKDSAVFQQILSRIQTSDRDAACEDCRDESVSQRGGKGKNKANKKKGGAAPAEGVIWVCLNCIHPGCGGGVKDLMPYGHARRHAKQENHSLAVRLDNILTCFCFLCNSLISIKMPEGVDAGLPSAESKEAVSIGDSDAGQRPSSDGAEHDGKGYAVRGLANLGNTCFFNSIMQNLLSMGTLREYFSSLNETLGPLTMSLKKLFAETSACAEASRGSMNPKNFFGCICSKAPQFKGYQQQDSHELLRYLLDGLCTEELNSKKHRPARRDSTTFVDVIFGGQLSSTVCCTECGHTSVVYEPFLDLSLPVPSKKALQKKSSVSMAKRSKIPTRQELRSRKTKERGIVRLPPVASPKTENADATLGKAQMKPETTDLLSECSGSYCTACPSHDQEQTSSLAPCDSSWLDFVGPIPGSSQNIEETVSSLPCSSGTYGTPSEDVETSALAVVDESCSDFVGPSQSNDDLNQDACCGSDLKYSAEVLNDEALSNKDAVRNSSDSEEKKDVHNLEQCSDVSGKVIPTYSVVGEEPAEDELGLLGDLFAEPEVNSSPCVPKSTGENSNMSWLEGTGSESNQEEVDNTDAPVSIARCLAYFTKPELLSGEHAWHCENCSKILQQQMLEKYRGKQPVDKDGTFEAVESSFSYERPVYDNGKTSLVDSEHHNTDSGGEADIQTNGLAEIASSLPDQNCDCKDNCSENSGKDEDLTVSSDSNYLSCASTSASAPEYSQGSTGPTVTIEGALCQNHEIEDSAPANGGGRTGFPQRRKKIAKVAHRMSNSKENENGSENVKVKRDATKRILINKVPPILTVHLKRFNQDARGRLNKLNGHVSFQEVIDLAPYIDPRCQTGLNYCYRLIGVVEHSGGMGGGHYVAYVRGERAAGKAAKDGSGSGNRWFYASDAHVREVSLSEVLQSEAYILFYEKIQP